MKWKMKLWAGSTDQIERLKTYTFSIQIWNFCSKLGKYDDGKQQKYMILTL